MAATHYVPSWEYNLNQQQSPHCGVVQDSLYSSMLGIMNHPGDSASTQ